MEKPLKTACKQGQPNLDLHQELFSRDIRNTGAWDLSFDTD